MKATRAHPRRSRRAVSASLFFWRSLATKGEALLRSRYADKRWRSRAQGSPPLGLLRRMTARASRSHSCRGHSSPECAVLRPGEISPRRSCDIARRVRAAARGSGGPSGHRVRLRQWKRSHRRNRMSSPRLSFASLHSRRRLLRFPGRRAQPQRPAPTGCAYDQRSRLAERALPRRPRSQAPGRPWDRSGRPRSPPCPFQPSASGLWVVRVCGASCIVSPAYWAQIQLLGRARLAVGARPTCEACSATGASEHARTGCLL